MYHNWNDQTRLRYDSETRKVYDNESKGPGMYSLGTPGLRGCESQNTYAQHMQEPLHWQKQYRSPCYVDQDSVLRHSSLTDRRFIHQLMTRPYLGVPYMGAGQNTSNYKDVESSLIQGLDTRGGPRKACDVLSGVSVDRFECLPEYGNPQRVQHVVEPWIRGGANTRDYVRRVKYRKPRVSKCP